MKGDVKKDPFALDNLAFSPVERDRHIGKLVERSPKRSKEAFVKVPVSLAQTLDALALKLAVCLIHESWRNKGEAVALSNILAKKWRLTRAQKAAALKELEALGLAQVQREGKASPNVKLATAQL
jgi:hypothetical protein